MAILWRFWGLVPWSYFPSVHWSGGHYKLLLATDHAHPGQGGGGAHPAVPAQHTGVQPLIAPGSSVFFIFLFLIMIFINKKNIYFAPKKSIYHIY